MPHEMSKSAQIDWLYAEREYRRGVKSLNEIGKEVGCSHVSIINRAKKFGWTRGVQEQVQLVATDKLLRTGRNKIDQMSVEDMIEYESDLVLGVLLLERQEVSRITDAYNRLFNDLYASEDPLRVKAEVFSKLVITGEKMMNLRRRNYGINDTTKAPDDPKDKSVAVDPTVEYLLSRINHYNNAGHVTH